MTLGKIKFRTFLLTMQQQHLFVVLVGRGQKFSIMRYRFLIMKLYMKMHNWAYWYHYSLNADDVLYAGKPT